MPLVIQRLHPCSGRTLFIGDVHGCAQELETLIAAFAPGPADRLVAVGDLVNRGPDSRGVLGLIREHAIHCLLGNHEQRLLRAWESGNRDLLKAKDRTTFSKLDDADFERIRPWPHVIEIPSLKVVAVHGGFAPGVPWREQDPLVVTHIQVLDRLGRPARRSDAPNGRPWAETWKGPEHVIYGHTPRPHPLLHPKATGLDTGCVYGYTLTALSLPDGEFFRVHARRPYVD
ncbi:MAG: metallophosphoesterase [Oceanipulchritudo sp.]